MTSFFEKTVNETKDIDWLRRAAIREHDDHLHLLAEMSQLNTAYLRLRRLIPDAMNTPKTFAGIDTYAWTEECLRQALPKKEPPQLQPEPMSQEAFYTSMAASLTRIADMQEKQLTLYTEYLDKSK
jgi:hypothetical protein